ncbi:FabD/lysophospholipase-like protein [Wilcoxina mikolae CBS 423.85]|nr:FabD/lysophospholipase-like protein [Wilcoxina mikolae CBS 423.85]
MFSASKLENVMRRIIAERTGLESQLLQEYRDDHSSPVFVVAIDKEKASLPEGVTLFRSYHVPDDKFSNVSIVEAARATSAAPTFFKPMRISTSTETKHFVDGGLGHNNPVLHVIEEAERIYPLAEIGCIISIGTGVQQGVRLAAEGTVRTNMFVLPFIKLFEHQKMDAMIRATHDYLGLALTTTCIRKCISQLINMRVNPNSRNKRRTFSSPNDISSLIESTINPAILDSIQQQAVEPNWDIAPESLWSQTTDLKVIPTFQTENHLSDQGLPIGNLVFSFNVLSGGQGSNPTVHFDRDTYRRHRFQPPKPVHIPNGRWRSTMAYMLVVDIGDQGDGTECHPPARDWRMPESEGCITLGISVFMKRESETERTDPIDEGTTISVPVPESCATWSLVESCGYFDVVEGDQITFEVWWDASNVSEDMTRRSKLYFGGISTCLAPAGHNLRGSGMNDDTGGIFVSLPPYGVLGRS